MGLVLRLINVYFGRSCVKLPLWRRTIGVLSARDFNNFLDACCPYDISMGGWSNKHTSPFVGAYHDLIVTIRCPPIASDHEAILLEFGHELKPCCCFLFEDWWISGFQDVVSKKWLEGVNVDGQHSASLKTRI